MSDKDVLILVGKLVSRATTLLFYTFRDSDCNSMKKAEQADRRRRKSIPDGIDVVPDGMEAIPDGIEVPPAGINSTESYFWPENLIF